MIGAGRIGVFGGTFDPPHIGHLVTALEVRHEMSLDQVLVVVAGDPWQKRGTRSLTPAAGRLAMVAAALEGLPGLVVDDREVRRDGPSYMVDTCKELLSDGDAAELFVILGSDTAIGIETWHRCEELAELAEMVVVDRPGAPVAERSPLFRWHDVEVPALAVSSSDLRARVAAGRPIDVLVPAGAVSWIREHHLYRGGP